MHAVALMSKTVGLLEPSPAGTTNDVFKLQFDLMYFGLLVVDAIFCVIENP